MNFKSITRRNIVIGKQLLAICGICIACITTSAFADEQESIGELTKDLPDVDREIQSTRIYLQKSIERYSDLHNKIQQNEKESEAALASAKTDAERNDISAELLRKRIQLLDQFSEEMSFTSDRMREVVQRIGDLVGGLGDAAGAAARAANQSQVTEKLIGETEQLQREYLVLESQEPAADSDEYWDWFERVEAKEIAFDEAVQKVVESAQDAVLYEQIADGLNMKREDTARWRVFTGRLTRQFRSNASKVSAARRRAQTYLEYIEATKSFVEGTELASFISEMMPLMKDIEGLKPPTVSGTPVTDSTRLVMPPLEFQIKNTDVRAQVERITSQTRVQLKGEQQ